jgi:hypothetical protein
VLLYFLRVAESHGGQMASFHPARAREIQTVVTFLQVTGPIFGPAIAAALTAWFQGRAGRKVRMRVGDIEIEAGTRKEFDRLLERALALKADQTNSEREHK